MDAKLSRQLDQLVKTIEALRELPQSPARDEAIARHTSTKAELERRIA